LILKLKSGNEIAFAVPWWPDSRNVAIFRHDPKISGQQVIDELLDLTSLDPQTVTLLGPW
jgi:hypothetical protein